MLALSTSWNARRHTSGKDIVNEIKSLGFDKIELSFNLTEEIVDDVKAMVENKEVEVTSIHNFCPIPDSLDADEALPDCYSLSSLDKEERAIAIKYTKRTIDTASILGAKVVILHCGRVEMQDRTKVLASIVDKKGSPQYEKEKKAMIRERNAKRDVHIESLKKSLGELIRYAGSKEVELAVENRYYFMEIPSVEEIGILIGNFPSLFYWHDVGHAQNLENLGLVRHEDYLSSYRDKIIGFHLHNIIGTRDHLAVHMGEFDFSRLKPYIGKDVLLVIESHYPATAEQMREGRIFLENLFGICLKWRCTMVREPAVAGQFYPGTAASLQKQLTQLIDSKATKEDAIGVVSPHAGYIYSGFVAGATLPKIPQAETFVILGPNHTGLGQTYSVMAKGRWKTPLGEVKIDEKLAGKILSGSQLLKEDTNAHLYEHSVEVQLPFLQYIFKEFEFVPIVLSHADGATYKKIGLDLSRVIKESKKKIVIIASSDMTHYEPHDQAKAKDEAAIKAILKLDVDMLLEKIADLDITMCGYGPVSVMLAAAKELGAKSAQLVKYQTSGDISGDYSSVVGYAGIVVT